jgi:hypothetical protein
MSHEECAYHELCCYTLAHGGPEFIHQHVVDAFGAQDAGEHDKPIRLAFSLVGLYLHVEKGLAGRQVQLAHTTLARRKRAWPAFPLPHDRGRITAADVLAAPAGPGRDEMIHEWCVCVWEAFRESRWAVMDLLEECKFFA